MGNRRRISNYRRGVWAEWVALLWLMLQGYWPVARRYKTKVGEIDLILRRGNQLVFVEVKARAVMAEAAGAIRAASQARIARAAEWFLQAHPAYQAYAPRFDAVLLARGTWPQHLVNAFALR